MACEKASANPLHKKIVDQITAVDNFIAFKRLMVKRNTELNEQAIKMLTGQTQQQQQPSSQQQTHVTGTQQPVPTAPVQAPQKVKITKEMIEAEKRAEEELMRQAMEMSLREEQEKN